MMRRLRSRFLPLSAVPVALLLALLLIPQGACSQPEEEKPGSVIFMIGDGMGPAAIALARWALLEPGERLALEQLPEVGWVTTYAADNAVTDSAASGTAMAAGIKTNNQMIGMSPDEQPVRTLADVAQNQGWKVGYVTTTEITHATPASFYGSIKNRYKPEEVDKLAPQLLEQARDVVLAGGWADFLPYRSYGSRQDDRNVLEEFEAAGYTLWQDREDLEGDPPEKLLGLLAGGHMPYELDNQRLPEALRYPDLQRLTEVALEALGSGDKPFFLMIEGGRIDHAAHSFDAAGVIAEMAAFDRAVETVMQYQKEHPETLVVITADHCTGGLAINDFVDWEMLSRQSASVDWMKADVRDEEDPKGAEYLDELTGFDQYAEEEVPRFTEEEVLAVRLEGDSYNAGRVLGQAIGERTGVTWLPRVDGFNTGGHTGEDVPIFAAGPGAEAFGGNLDNTDIPKIIGRLLGWPEPGLE
jgi:alkaline phosphatase